LVVPSLSHVPTAVGGYRKTRLFAIDCPFR
jgi:hypothetical protein